MKNYCSLLSKLPRSLCFTGPTSFWCWSRSLSQNYTWPGCSYGFGFDVGVWVILVDFKEYGDIWNENS